LLKGFSRVAACSVFLGLSLLKSIRAFILLDEFSTAPDPYIGSGIAIQLNDARRLSASLAHAIAACMGQ